MRRGSKQINTEKKSRSGRRNISRKRGQEPGCAGGGRGLGTLRWDIGDTGPGSSSDLCTPPAARGVTAHGDVHPGTPQHSSPARALISKRRSPRSCAVPSLFVGRELSWNRAGAHDRRGFLSEEGRTTARKNRVLGSLPSAHLHPMRATRDSNQLPISPRLDSSFIEPMNRFATARAGGTNSDTPRGKPGPKFSPSGSPVIPLPNPKAAGREV